MDELDILGIMIFLLIIGLLMFVIFDVSITPLKEKINAMHEFCEEKGYEKATDWNFKTSVTSYSVQIECDNIKMYHANLYEGCHGFDKWGECKDYKWEAK